MQSLFDFIDNPSTSRIFSQLKCDQKEARILQFMLKEYLLGIQDSSVFELVKKVFNPKDERELVAYIPCFSHLLELGWIIEDSFSPIDITQTSLLEMLHLDIMLSSSFLRLIEGILPESESIEITPYGDHLEYLKDQFSRISLLQKLTQEKITDKNKIKYRLKDIEEKITARLQITKKTIPLRNLILEYHLNSKEEIIFFALLKEEYSGGNENLRDLNTLIELISSDEYEKIKNRSLLDEKSTLISKKLLDYDELLSPFGGISRTFYIREEILQKIFHPKDKQRKTKISLQSVIQEQEVFELLEPKENLNSIVLPDTTRKTLETLLQQATPRVSELLKLWGIKDKKGFDAKIIFHGASGTGKTITALGIAKSLKKQVLSLDCSKILSMYVGESEKNVKKIFDEYKEISKQFKNPPILLFDEADQFLSLRVNSGNSAEKMHNQMQNIFLEQIEKFEGILIATTNLIETIDNAFSRRFNYKIEFKKPNESERILLWEKYLPKNASFKNNNSKSIQTKELAKNLSSFPLTGGQIALVVKNTAYEVALKSNPIFEEKDFINQIQKELRNSFDSQKNLGFQA